MCAVANWLAQPFPEIQTTIAFQSSDLTHPGCRELYDWWHGHQPEQPARHSFDIVDHPQLAPDIYLTELLDGRQFRVRLQGEQVKSLMAPVGFPLSFALGDPDPIGQVASNYVQSITRNVPLRHTGTLKSFEKDFVSFEGVDVPLAGTDKNRGYILGVIYALEND